MTMYKHECVRPSCGESYEDTDPDAYYCKSCIEQNKKVAAEVDAKAALRPSRKHKSALAEYDESQKVHGFVQVRL